MSGSSSNAEARFVSELSPLRRALLTIICLLMLSWPALMNRQPFFFADTTSYIRAGDAVVELLSRGHVTSPWSDRGGHDLRRDGLVDGETPNTSRQPSAAAVPSPRTGVNDLTKGTVMAGRSPYFGVLLYLSYLFGGFWPFVLLASAASLYLIATTLRLFGAPTPVALLIVVGLLAIGTTIAFYDSYLMADILAAHGLLAFSLLATCRDRLRRRQVAILILLMVVSAASHFTHELNLAAMLAAFLLALAARKPIVAQGWNTALLAGSVLIVGGLSVVLTNAAIKHQFGRSPELLPLLTARIVADGPGADYIRNGCHDRFVVCRFADRLPVSDFVFLWSRDPKRGVYLVSDDATRQALQHEDKSFARAVFSRYPLPVVGSMIVNTERQLLSVESEQIIGNGYEYLAELPPAERWRIAATPAGRSQWPVPLIDALHASVAVIAGFFVAVALTIMARRRRAGAAMPDAKRLAMLTLLIGTGLLANAFQGGALSDPQGRYQGRVIWLVPLLALLFAFSLTKYRETFAARVNSDPPG